MTPHHLLWLGCEYLFGRDFPEPYPEPHLAYPSGTTLDDIWSELLKRRLCIHSDAHVLAIPTNEESVLMAGALNSFSRSPGISLTQALTCTHRKMQRGALADISPRGFTVPLYQVDKWQQFNEGIETDKWVVRAMMSTMSVGVQVATSDMVEAAAHAVLYTSSEARQCVREIMPHEEARVLIEEHVDGPCYEVSGFNLGGATPRLFEVLRQEWSTDHRHIDAYHVEADEGIRAELQRLTVEVIQRLELRWCGFCLEWRGTPGALRLMEVNARLGEEVDSAKGYARAVSGEGDYRQVMVEAISDAWPRSD